MTITILTADNLDACNLPSDMRAEVAGALSAGRESAIEYRREGGRNEQPTHYVYFPEADRGGVCEGGNTDWTDCDGLDDLVARWGDYEERWSN